MQNKSIKLTDEIIEIFATTAASGGFFADASALAGIPEALAQEWFDKGATARSGRYHAFHWAWRKNLALFEMECLRKVREGGPDWESNAKALELRFPERWAEGGTVDPEEERFLASLSNS